MTEERGDLSTAIAELAGMMPGVKAVAGSVARNTVQRLLGFWILYHLAGSLEAGIAGGAMTRASGYRQRAEFREVFGVDVEDFAPEITASFSKVQREEIRD